MLGSHHISLCWVLRQKLAAFSAGQDGLWLVGDAALNCIGLQSMFLEYTLYTRVLALCSSHVFVFYCSVGDGENEYCFATYATIDLTLPYNQ